MKKNEIKKKLSLDKFKIAEIKNMRVIAGGIAPENEEEEGGGTGGGNKIPPILG